jgi:DNA-binding MltR family transcriptional regulator
MASASKKLLKELPTRDSMVKTLVGLGTATDQAVALTCVAYLDHALQTLLKVHFRHLNKDQYHRIFDGAGNGILGTASAKILIAYAMGLIEFNTYTDLVILNNVRNAFAHTLHTIDFENGHIKEDCAKLKARDETVSRMMQDFGDNPAIVAAFAAPKAKERFLHSAIVRYFQLRHEVETRAAKGLQKDKS